MATRVQLRRGTTLQNNAFTGAEGELTYDTTTKGLRIHDGSHQGGYEVVSLVAVQRPSAANNYTWYRKWSDGWVEQGGRIARDTAATATVTFPVPFAEKSYTVNLTGEYLATTANAPAVDWNSSSATQCVLLKDATQMGLIWEAKGMAA